MNLSRLRKPLAMFGIVFGLAVSTQAEAVIVIRGRNGRCICIGSHYACADACGGVTTAKLSGYDHVALAVGDASYEGNSLAVSDIADDGTAFVALQMDGETLFEERVTLADAVVTDLENGDQNTLAALTGLVSCQ